MPFRLLPKAGGQPLISKIFHNAWRATLGYAFSKSKKRKRMTFSCTEPAISSSKVLVMCWTSSTPEPFRKPNWNGFNHVFVHRWRQAAHILAMSLDPTDRRVIPRQVLRSCLSPFLFHNGNIITQTSIPCDGRTFNQFSVSKGSLEYVRQLLLG